MFFFSFFLSPKAFLCRDDLHSGLSREFHHVLFRFSLMRMCPVILLLPTSPHVCANLNGAKMKMKKKIFIAFEMEIQNPSQHALHDHLQGCFVRALGGK